VFLRESKSPALEHDANVVAHELDSERVGVLGLLPSSPDEPPHATSGRPCISRADPRLPSAGPCRASFFDPVRPPVLRPEPPVFRSDGLPTCSAPHGRGAWGAARDAGAPVAQSPVK